VQLLVGYGNPHTRRPIGVATLDKRFPQEIDRGRAAMEGLLCTALTHQIRAGHVTAIIWAMKNLMGWADHVETHRTGSVDVNIQLNPEDLAKLLEERGLPSFVLGIDKPVLELEARRIDGPSGNGSKR
jgi:hypothetical protein